MTIRLSCEIVDLPSGLSVVRETHSWVKAIAQIYSARNNGDLTAVIKDTAGGTFTFKGNSGAGTVLDVSAASADDTHGMQVGTSTTAITKDDNALNTKIATGTRFRRVEYLAQVIDATLGISGGYRVTLSRQFDNNSGGSITVEECGVVVNVIDTSSVQKFALILHDLQTVVIANSTSKIIKYHLDFLV